MREKKNSIKRCISLLTKQTWHSRLAAILAVLLFFLSVPVCYAQENSAPEDTVLYAKAAVLMDADSGRVLYGKNESEVLPMASTTKIMTCIVALENGNLQETVTASAYAAGQPKVHLGVQRGQQFLLEDLLYSMMLESHNDAAVIIAEHIGSAHLNLPEAGKRTKEESRKAVAAFAGMMNQKARDIGCFDTFFVTPNGLDASAAGKDGSEIPHSTTARDLAAIMKYCIRQSPKREEFLVVTRTPSYSFQDKDGKRSYSCNNHNAFLNMMEGALSGKTGFTNAAGYCYVGALERDGKCFTIALLACGWPNHKTWKWKDTAALMNYGLDNYEPRSLDTPQEVISLKQLPVEGGQTGVLGETASVRVSLESDPLTILMRPDEQVEIRTDIRRVLQAPVEAGEQIGTVAYLIDGKLYKTDFLRTEDSILAIDYFWCLKMTVRNYLIRCS